MRTTEYYNGIKHSVYANFRKYPSWAESIADHSAMFNRMSRYANLRGETDYVKACKNVEADGYATAIDPKTGKPNYANTLLSAIKTHHLYEWDKDAITGVISDALTAVEDINRNPYNEPSKNIRFNSRGNDVRWLQFALNEHGYHLIVDGYFKDKTQDAVIDFQKSVFPNDPREWDGIVGNKTREKLKNN